MLLYLKKKKGVKPSVHSQHGLIPGQTSALETWGTKLHVNESAGETAHNKLLPLSQQYLIFTKLWYVHWHLAPLFFFSSQFVQKSTSDTVYSVEVARKQDLSTAWLGFDTRGL